MTITKVWLVKKVSTGEFLPKGKPRPWRSKSAASAHANYWSRYEPAVVVECNVVEATETKPQEAE